MNDLKFKVLSLKPVPKKDYFRVTLIMEINIISMETITQYNIKEDKSIENKVIHKALDYTERENIKCKIIAPFYSKEAKRN